MSILTWLHRWLDRSSPINASKDISSDILDQLKFIPSEKLLTLGVEFELSLVDSASLRPAFDAEDIIKSFAVDNIKPELALHVVEITTGICSSVQQAEADLSKYIHLVEGHIEPKGLRLCATGRLPNMKTSEFTQTPGNDRYKLLSDRRKLLMDRFGLTQGMHIHLGVKNAEQCIRYHNFFMHFLPHLIALSASSPFEDGVDTGLATIRPTITEALPVAGLPYQFHNWQEYENLCIAMYRAGSIVNLKDLWWDLRPCPRYGTMEIRVCDQPATLAEAMAIAAFVHALGHWFEEHQSWLDEMPRPGNWRMRENKWRAMRYGLDADLVTNAQGEVRPIATDIRQWLNRLEPQFLNLDYMPYADTLNDMLDRGNSSSRQRAVMSETHSLTNVIAFNCDELVKGAPIWSEPNVQKNPDLSSADKSISSIPVTPA